MAGFDSRHQGVTTAEIALIDPEQSSPAEMRDWCIYIRSRIPYVESESPLEQIEACLVAVARQLRRLGDDATEAERTRIRAMQQIGHILGPGEAGAPAKERRKNTTLLAAQRDHRWRARLLDQFGEVIDREIGKPKVTLNRVVKLCQQVRGERLKAEIAPAVPLITLASFDDWLPDQPDCDLLLTDPPYSTDVADVYGFANEWLPLALKKVKPTGRAYVCIGAYPAELHAYLSVPCGDLTLANVLVWTYRNTLGPSPALGYKLNWQAILYYHGPDAPPLDSPLMTEQFSVADINAPDGRQADRYHAWQKPAELGERFVRHATKPGDLVLDPFAGTGTFLLSAALLGRDASGCDADPAMLAIATQRGCQRA